MRFLKRAVAIVCAGMLLLFVLMNSQPLVLHFLFFGGEVQAPVSVVLLAVFLLGFLLGAGALHLAASARRKSRDSAKDAA